MERVTVIAFQSHFDRTSIALRSHVGQPIAYLYHAHVKSTSHMCMGTGVGRVGPAKAARDMCVSRGTPRFTDDTRP